MEDFDYKTTRIRDIIYNAMDATQFVGVSVRNGTRITSSFAFPSYVFVQGKVGFSKVGDRIALTQIEQMQNGKYVLLGYLDVENMNFSKNNEADAKWPGKTKNT